MSDRDKRQAWADFWHEDQRRDGGCLAGAAGELGRIQSTIWDQFARTLKRGARVLDLGTGDGIVLKQFARARSDLRLTGVDSAPTLPKASGKLRLQAGVAMEDLPFADASFEAAVSQFGYEYGDTPRVAREVSRILAPGGSYLFLVHRHDSPVVSHNRGRADALQWAVRDSGLIERARALAAARRTLALPTPAGFREAIGDANRRFPGQAVAPEIAQAILQALSLPPQHSLAALDELERKAKGELTRLDALTSAARDEGAALTLINELRAAGLGAEPPRPVLNRSGLAFAWRLEGRA